MKSFKKLDKKIPVGVLAATGMVGQRFVQLLENHPWFEVIAVSGSIRSEGKPYGEICNWILPEPMPERVKPFIVQLSEPDRINAPLVFSALPSAVALEVEVDFARAGVVVCSNASANRNESDVPILLPEVNPGHIDLLPVQREKRGWSGLIITNPNCTSTGLTIALKPLLDLIGIKSVFATSLQALSGAGYPGVPSLDVIGNVIPYIKGEEDKVESEPLIMLGEFNNGIIIPSELTISAHTNRVAVVDGHVVCMSVELKEKVDLSVVENALIKFTPEEVSQNLPSTPVPVIQVRHEPDRPQPRLDCSAGEGMTTVVGRLRPDPLFDYKMVVFSHNTIRGAAGGSIYNAELLVQEGYVTT